MKKVPKRVKPVAAATLTMGCLTLAIPLVTNTFGIELWARFKYPPSHLTIDNTTVILSS
jgi:hypothetical protein